MSSEITPTMHEYLQLLDLTYEVAQSLKGKSLDDHRWPDIQQLALKLFYHAASIYFLRLGTKVPVPYSTGQGAFFYDLASVTVLARAALETYLTMFEVFFEPTTEDDFEFNHALWLLSGFKIREDFIPTDPELQERIVSSQEEIQEMRDRLAKTEKFKALSKSQKKDVLMGFRRRPRSNVAQAAGFGEEFIRRVYGYYSGYVHADGLSGTQLFSLKTGQEQTEFIENHMRTVMIILSKMILDGCISQSVSTNVRIILPRVES